MLKYIKNLVKTAYVTLVNGDDTSYPNMQVGYKRKVANCTRLSPYGLDSNPPRGSFVLLLSAYGQESSKFGIPADLQRRIKGLKEGEVALHNTMTQSSIILRQNGDVEIDASGSVIMNGTPITLNGVDWLTHQHVGVKAGTEISGGVKV